MIIVSSINNITIPLRRVYKSQVNWQVQDTNRSNSKRQLLVGAVSKPTIEMLIPESLPDASQKYIDLLRESFNEFHLGKITSIRELFKTITMLDMPSFGRATTDLYSCPTEEILCLDNVLGHLERHGLLTNNPYVFFNLSEERCLVVIKPTANSKIRSIKEPMVNINLGKGYITVTTGTKDRRKYWYIEGSTLKRLNNNNKLREVHYYFK